MVLIAFHSALVGPKLLAVAKIVKSKYGIVKPTIKLKILLVIIIIIIN